MNKVPQSNKAWRKTHLFEGECVTKKNGKVVDKNNHKVELVIINDKAYRK
jgi:hypothetical protein